MGTITARKRKDGSTGYRAQVRVTRDGKSHSETETFDRKALAQQWMRMKEAEIDRRRIHPRLQIPGHPEFAFPRLAARGD
ncbi:hypothetical protein [Rhodanobacter sp. MP1X3]|uniref:hypothetical protein n=1 Tax=Rhodanobacter sp. MP1X3 TaxID=2723086 RepID=UPI001610D6C4|nr:hypothetical protein [Rhodanobacter sp. MP1X3]MBB6242588.1 hypothetical protein [Rhodanobacter sp. MP1X3]